jgi:hypothetical protein
MLEPAATNLRLANHTLHLVMQGLFTLTKMQRAPERGRQVLKLARQDYFDVAWGLFRIAGAVGLVSPDAQRGWAQAREQLVKDRRRSDEEPESGDQKQPRERRRRRRRRPRRRKKQ